MKMKKRFFDILLSLMLVLLPAFAAEATDWDTSDRLPNTAGDYKLTTDVTISNTWNVPGTTTLDLNGYGITKTGNGGVITIGSGASLTINDRGNTTHYYTVSNHLATVNGNGEFSFNGGYITGGVNKEGGCINLYGTLIINGGTIIGNRGTDHGGGIFARGNLTINGGQIIYNKTTYQGGGIDAGGTVTINGGIIKNNYSEGTVLSHTGGIHCVSDVNFTLSGNPVIKDNENASGISNVALEFWNNRLAYIHPGSGLTSGADIGVFTQSNPSDTSDVKFVLTGAKKEDVQYYTSDKDEKAGVIFCDGTNDWAYVDGVAQMRSGVVHHEHEANTIWLSVAANGSNIENNTKAIQTITADNVTATYGDTNKSVSASVTDPLSGGKISYAVKAGSENYIEVDPETGGLTIKKVPSDNLAYIIVTAAEITQDNTDYGMATKEVTVIIEKAAAPISLTDDQIPTAKEPIYTGEPQDLVTQPNEPPTGYTVLYSLDGTNWSKNIPQGTNAGNYNVQVKYVDEEGNRKEFKGESIPVTITLLTDNRKPTEKSDSDLVYDGFKKELVNKPEEEIPEPYTMKYAVTSTADEEPGENDYIYDNENLPTGTDVGTYYVWYKAVGDENHEDSTAEKIQVIINPEGTPDLEDAQRPTKKEGLVYTGDEQPLVEAPKNEVPGYTVMYSLDGEKWSTKPPTGTDAGTYTVKVKYEGDANHTSFDGKDITVTIQPANAPDLNDDQKPTKKDEPEVDQPLLNEPKEPLPEGYTMMYALGDANNPTGEWSSTIPSGTEATTYYVWYKAVSDDPNRSATIPEFLDVTIAEKTEELTVKVDNLKQDASRGLPSEIKELEDELEINMTITIEGDNGVKVQTVKPLTITIENGVVTSIDENASFNGKIEGLAPGKQKVTVSVTPKQVVGQDTIHTEEGDILGPVKWKYELSARGEINEIDGKDGKEMVVRIYLIWDNGVRPEPIKVVALPEDEVGAYQLREDGTKEYLLFHTYDICMQWLGSDELCRGYERCFHKENAFVNPFVKP